MKRTIRILAVLTCLLAALCMGFAMAEEGIVVPTPTPMPTPAPEDLDELTFLISGPEFATPMPVKYSEFVDGALTLENLAPGTYTVTEVDPDRLLEGLNYVFDEEGSIQSVTLEVSFEETATERLVNIYTRTQTATDTPVPEDTPTPIPGPEGVIDIPVVKIWDDYDNRDGNRPKRVIVYLLANGSKAGQAVLNAENGWSYVFKEMPQYSGGKEIIYTVSEESVPMYVASIDGYVITNVYSPATTSVTVSKIWADNDNAAGIRPLSIYCTLSNGMRVLLSEENNWTATIDNLPTIVKGKEVKYTWKEQESIGYEQTGKETVGNTTTFTNSLIERKRLPAENPKVPTKERGNKFLIIEDYGTPLGVDVIINHVGDCFD